MNTPFNLTPQLAQEINTEIWNQPISSNYLDAGNRARNNLTKDILEEINAWNAFELWAVLRTAISYPNWNKKVNLSA